MENREEKVQALLKKVEPIVNSNSYIHKKFIMYIEDPDFLVVAYTPVSLRTNKHWFIVFDKMTSYQRLEWTWIKATTIYGTKLRPITKRLSYYDSTINNKAEEYEIIGCKHPIPGFGHVTSYIQYFRIKNVDEIADKMIKIGIKTPYNWMRNVKNSEETSLKGIFGTNNFKLLQFVNKVCDGTSGCIGWYGSILDNDTYSPLLKVVDYPDIVEGIHQRIRLFREIAYSNNSYSIFQDIKTLTTFLSDTQLIKYLRFYLNNARFLTRREDASNRMVWEHDLFVDYLSMRRQIESFYDIRKLPVLINNFEGDPNDLLQSLRKKHDFVMRLYYVHVEELKIERAKAKEQAYHDNVYAKAKEFEMEIDNYIIKAPIELSELILEGKALNHCVGSYITSVSEGREYILFLRNKNTPNISYFTIDITPDKTVRQIHGSHNCNLPQQLKPVIQKWAKAKGVNISHTSGVHCAL